MLGTAITTGDDNIAVGYQALDANTTGSSNSAAVGSNALAHKQQVIEILVLVLPLAQQLQLDKVVLLLVIKR